MNRTLGAIAIAAVAMMLVAAGCGGDDDDDGGTTAATTGATGGEALSKQEFISQADAICKQGNKELNREARETFSDQQEPSTEEQEQFITDSVLPNVQNQIDSIGALTPPEGDEGEVTAILDAAQDAIDQGEQDPSLLANEGGEDPFEEANKLAGQYGLKECG